MKNIFSSFIFLVVFLCSSQVIASELLVLIQEGSNNSKRWKDEVWKEYTQLEDSMKLPLKIVSFKADNFPSWVSKAIEDNRIGRIMGTPTFIIWDEVNKKEVGRFEGYTQKKNFFSQLNETVRMVNQGQNPGRREGSDGHREEGSGGSQKQEGTNEMSRDIMDHVYKTPEEAKRFSELLGFGGVIHSHKTPEGTIFMPGPTM